MLLLPDAIPGKYDHIRAAETPNNVAQTDLLIRWLLRHLSGYHLIQQLTYESKRVDLVIIFSGRKAQQL